MSLPAISSVRAGFPEAKIHILAKPWVAEVFAGMSGVDGTILYQATGIHQGLRGRWRLARELKKEGFGLAILLPNSFDSAFLFYLSGISRRAGYKTDGRGWLLTHPAIVSKEVKKGHQVDYYLHLVASLGFPPEGRIPSLKAHARCREEVQGILQSCGVTDAELLVGISPGASYGSAKEWFPERYGELATRVARKLGGRVLLLGSRGDQKAANLIWQRASMGPVNLAGKTTLGQALALISRCRVLVTNDSGLMHVAAALGIPTVAIFGSTDPLRTGPLGETFRVLQKPIPCAPCLKPECPEDRKCMSLISVDEVFSEVEKLWHPVRG